VHGFSLGYEEGDVAAAIGARYGACTVLRIILSEVKAPRWRNKPILKD
jgi:hypothetical protein